MYRVPRWIKAASEVPLALQKAPHLQQLGGDELAHSPSRTRHQNGVSAFLRSRNRFDPCRTLEWNITWSYGRSRLCCASAQDIGSCR